MPRTRIVLHVIDRYVLLRRMATKRAIPLVIRPSNRTITDLISATEKKKDWTASKKLANRSGFSLRYQVPFRRTFLLGNGT